MLQFFALKLAKQTENKPKTQSQPFLGNWENTFSTDVHIKKWLEYLVSN